MKTFRTHWDTGGAVLLLQCESVAVSENKLDELRAKTSYYNIAVAGSGHIDLSTGRLDQRTRTYCPLPRYRPL